MKMRKKTIFCMLSLCLMSAASVNAQVTIGGNTDPVAGVLLDLNSPGGVRGGLLLSSIAIDDLGKIPANVLRGISSEQDENENLRGMMVYNTGTINVPPGIYIWNGYYWSPDGNCTPTVTTPPSPAFTVYSSTEYADLAITADGCPPLTYTWYENTEASTTGGTPINNSNRMTYQTPTGLAEGIHFYYCTVKSPFSNVVATSDLFTVTACLPLSQLSTITGSTSVCSGSSRSYSVDDVSGTIYTWSVPDDWNITDGQNTSSITVTAGNTGGEITVTPSNSCGSGTPQTLAVTVSTTVPEQPSTITGSTSVCSGSSRSYSVDDVSGTIYTWSVPDDWNITDGQNTSSITVTAGSTGGEITVTPSNSCGSGTLQTLEVTVSTTVPEQPGLITGSTSACSGSSQSYSVADVTGATEYEWALPSGWSFTTETTTRSITVTAGTTGGSISVKAKNSCGNSTARTLTVTGVPTQPGPITGPSGVPSQATGLIYSVVDVTGATEYEWTLPNGWSFTAGTTTRSITVTAGTSGGSISVKAKSSCGYSIARTLAITVLPSCPGYSGYLVTNGAYSGPPTSLLNGHGTTMSQITGTYGFAVSGNLCLAQADYDTHIHDWTSIATVCSNLGLGWRLPNIAELGNLQGSQTSYGMDQANYWSSTDRDDTSGWYWLYSRSYTEWLIKSQNYGNYVRCVRSL